jgi:hypothetical protein
MEEQMKKTVITLLLLSLALTGCVVDPGRGYGDHEYDNRGWDGHDHAEFHADHGQQGDWNH